jgi:hypothetical protein
MRPSDKPIVSGFSFVKYPNGNASRNAQMAAPLAAPIDNHAPIAKEVRGRM